MEREHRGNADGLAVRRTFEKQGLNRLKPTTYYLQLARDILRLLAMTVLQPEERSRSSSRVRCHIVSSKYSGQESNYRTKVTVGKWE